VMERLVEEISFGAPDRPGQTIRIDAAYVQDKIGKMAADADLSRFVL
jgi:ATP-dependent HslUV protease ATP-binding subunit HslU